MKPGARNVLADSTTGAVTGGAVAEPGPTAGGKASAIVRAPDVTIGAGD